MKDFFKILEEGLKSKTQKSNDILFQGMITGIEDMGARFLKRTADFVYFDILIGSKIDNEIKLKRAKDAFMRSFGVGVKIRKVTQL